MRQLLSVLIFFLTTLVMQPYALADFEEGIAAYDQGDYETAFREFLPLAEQGMAEAQFKLGAMYDKGHGVPQDYAVAEKWYHRAAEQGHAKAQYNLGYMYLYGDGVPQNNIEAVKWLRRGADQGDARAQSDLGALYAMGQGVPQDYVQAHLWFNLAAAQGDDNAVKNRDIVIESMTPAQLALAQQLAREWRPRVEDHRKEEQAKPSESQVLEPEMAASGTGIVVSNEGHIITNHHVIAECTEVRVAPSTIPVPLVANDAVNDLALLKTNSNLTPASFREGRSIQQGEDVTVIGYPLHGLLASGPNVSTGIVSALAGPGNDTRLLQITAPVQPGNSGGPLLDASGNVVGVIVAKLDAIEVAQVTGDIPQNINFAINAAMARNFLDANGIRFKTAKSDDELPTSDVAEHARSYTVLIECWK